MFFLMFIAGLCKLCGGASRGASSVTLQTLRHCKLCGSASSAAVPAVLHCKPCGSAVKRCDPSIDTVRRCDPPGDLSLYVTLCSHALDDTSEACDVCACNIVVLQVIIFGCRLDLLVDVLHDLLELFVYAFKASVLLYCIL